MSIKSKEKKDIYLKELEDLKRLLILHLLKQGASQTEVALALNVNKSTVSRMFPYGKIKKFTESD